MHTDNDPDEKVFFFFFSHRWTWSPDHGVQPVSIIDFHTKWINLTWSYINLGRWHEWESVYCFQSAFSHMRRLLKLFFSCPRPTSLNTNHLVCFRTLIFNISFQMAASHWSTNRMQEINLKINVIEFLEVSSEIFENVFENSLLGANNVHCALHNKCLCWYAAWRVTNSNCILSFLQNIDNFVICTCTRQAEHVNKPSSPTWLAS